MGARVGHTSKLFNVREKCGYIELQLRRIFGVTHDTETQLWLLGNTGNELVSDRGKELMHYAVRYDTVFFILCAFTEINVNFVTRKLLPITNLPAIQCWGVFWPS